MAFEVTENAFNASNQSSIRPNFVLEIDGVSTLFGSITIQKFVRIGDEDLEIGDPETNDNAFYIGGFNEVDDQSSYIQQRGTSTSIRQTLQPDRGIGSTISTLKISLIDKNREITNLISPGQVVADILGRRARVYFGFNNTAWPDDYITLFRGTITDIDAGSGHIIFKINHPDDKKRKSLYKPQETTLNGAITSGATVIVLDDVDDIITRITGPDGTFDTSFESYIRIDDELIQFTGLSGNQLTGVTRGALGTIAAAHDDEADVKTFYRLQGNIVDLSLKLMLSGWNGPFLENQEITNFNIITPTENVSNAIFFKETDVKSKFGIVEGDFVTTTGASNAANNVTLKQISGIFEAEDGDYIVIDGVSFVNEGNTSAVIDFRSQYDTLPDGMKMLGDEVDIDEHERLFQLFFSSFEYDFYLKDEIDGKEFLETELYLPIAAYSLPRKSQASLGYHIGPIPGSNIQIISSANVKNPSQIKIRRSTHRNFYNEIVYAYEEDELEDQFLAGHIEISATSKNRIENAVKTLNIESKGLRRALNGGSISQSQASRLLDRYKFGAESFDIEVLFSIGFLIEPGDIVLFDGTNLQMSDVVNASRTFEPRLMEVVNKEFNLITGNIKLSITDTNFDDQARYCLISPASNIKSGISTTQFIIEDSFASKFGPNEFRKWNRFELPAVRVRNSDFTDNESTFITGVSGNTITVSPALTFTPNATHVLEFDSYNPSTDVQHLIYGWMTDQTTFDDGSDQYQML